jgi:hypothetical protein
LEEENTMVRVSSCAFRLSMSTFSHTAAKLKPGDETCAKFPNGQGNGSGSATPAANQWLHAVMPKDKVRRLMICVAIRPRLLVGFGGGAKKFQLSLVCLAILFCALVDVPTLLTISF